MLSCLGRAWSPMDSKNRFGGSCPDIRVGQPSRSLRVEREVERRHRRLVVPRKQALSNDIMHMLQRPRGASRRREGGRARAPAEGEDAGGEGAGIFASCQKAQPAGLRGVAVPVCLPSLMQSLGVNEVSKAAKRLCLQHCYPVAPSFPLK